LTLPANGYLYTFTLTCNEDAIEELSVVLREVAESLKITDTAPPVESEDIDPLAVHNSALGFSFTPPEGWIPRPANAAVFFKYSNFEAQRFVNILRIEGPPATAEQIRGEILSEGSVESDGFVNVDEVRSYWCKRKASTGGKELLIYQVTIPDPGGGAFIATFTSMSSDFDSAMVQFSEVVETIRISR